MLLAPQDMNSKTDLYRSNAIRVLCSICGQDTQLLVQIERYLKQAIVDKVRRSASLATRAHCLPVALPLRSGTDVGWSASKGMVPSITRQRFASKPPFIRTRSCDGAPAELHPDSVSMYNFITSEPTMQRLRPASWARRLRRWHRQCWVLRSQP